MHMGRSRWLVESEQLVRLVQEALLCSKSVDHDILFVFIARGGLILLPAVLATFPEALVSIISCDRDQGITSAMPLPDRHDGPVIVMDAVVATGGTVGIVVDYLRKFVPAGEIWIGSISCSDTAKAKITASGSKIVTLHDDTLSDSAPTVDMDGLDAGDTFQGFQADPHGPQGKAFSQMAGSPNEMERRKAIHTGVLDVIRQIAPNRVLDLGCGDGALTDRIAESTEVIGSDPDPEVMELVFANSVHPANVKYVKWGELKEIGTFDLINICMVLNAVADVGPLLELAKRCSTESGRQIWTLLHPAFSYDESLNAMRRSFEDGAVEGVCSLGDGYLTPHAYQKIRHGHVITNHHRPLSWYVGEFGRQGLMVESMTEPPPLGSAPTRLLPRVVILVTRAIC